VRAFLTEPEFLLFQRDRRSHWDGVAERFGGRRRAAKYYHQRLEDIFRFLVRPGLRILEVGCGEGDLIAALQPGFGVGIDFSSAMIEVAKRRHDSVFFVQADAHALPMDTTFDVIILSDLLNDVWEVQTVLDEVSRLSSPHTRILINSYNRLWEPLLAIADRLNVARPNLYQNWLTVEDLENLLYLSDIEIIRTWPEILWPITTPLLASFCNRFLCRFWPFHHLALTHLVVARPMPRELDSAEPMVSVIVPTRNESGNIPEIFNRMPDFSLPVEVIFVEGHSRDNTYEVIEAHIKQEKRWQGKLFRQQGEGKGDAVREGFLQAEGDILIILDADLTVPPEDLPRFIDALQSHRADFANGVRLVYPMHEEAMRFANLIGNKFFSLGFSWVLGQPIKDTLCGTKAMWRRDYEVIAKNRSYFGDIDPFGDFDLLLGAAKSNLKIVDIPIRYRSRTYGSTNISRWRHGALLFQMLFTAARKIKFV
jgi:SAM-dependent methyltransferase